jgi:hypothetical protein
MTLTATDGSNIEDAMRSLCDRRRSRAARELLRHHLIRTWEEANRILSSTSPKTTSVKDYDYHKYNMDVTEWNVWQLLDATIVPTNDNDSHREVNDITSFPICPLIPKYDLWKEHEESYSIFDMTSAMIPQRYRNSAIPGILHHSRTGPKHASKSMPSQQYQQLYPLMYHCDLCQKGFTSQYYLDQHLINKHPMTPNSSITPTLSDRICPADIYCSFLSPIVCDDYIMRHEPYYGPGHFVASDENTLNLQYTATKMTCDDQEQQKAIQRCHEIVALCFDASIRNGDTSRNTFGQILSTSMCGTIPNCQTRFVDSVMTTISLSAKNIFQRSYQYIHHPYSIYDHHTTSTWMALLIVTFIFILVFGHYTYQLYLAILQQQQKQRNEQHRRSTEATNIHQPQTSTKMIVQPPTTYIVPTKTKLT